MNMKMYSIKDRLNGYTTPIPFASEEVAKRYFKDQVLGNPTITNTKEDFELHYMGEFDTESGYYATPENGTILVEKAVNYERS